MNTVPSDGNVLSNGSPPSSGLPPAESVAVQAPMTMSSGNSSVDQGLRSIADTCSPVPVPDADIVLSRAPQNFGAISQKQTREDEGSSTVMSRRTGNRFQSNGRRTWDLDTGVGVERNLCTT